MIELLRYARVKPKGLVSAEIHQQPPSIAFSGRGLDTAGVDIKFKRFNVEDGSEESPEVSFVSFSELQQRLADIQVEMAVVKELLALQPGESNG